MGLRLFAFAPAEGHAAKSLCPSALPRCATSKSTTGGSGPVMLSRLLVGVVLLRLQHQRDDRGEGGTDGKKPFGGLVVGDD